VPNFTPSFVSAVLDLPQSPLGTKDTVILQRQATDDWAHFDFFANTAAQPLFFYPPTPNQTPRVKMPQHHPLASAAMPLAGDSPDYLNDVNIPSPLLYHDEHDFMPPVSDILPGCDFPYFEYACGQAQPEIDFTSYRDGSDAFNRPEPVDRRDSLGFALCDPLSSKHRLEESQVSDSSPESPMQGCPLPASLTYSHKRPTSEGFRCATSVVDHLLNDQFSVPLDPEWSWAKDIVRHRRLQCDEEERPYEFPCGDDALVYPTLPTPARIKHALTHNNIVQPWANQAAKHWERSVGYMQPLLSPTAQILNLRTPDFIPQVAASPGGDAQVTAQPGFADDPSSNLNNGSIAQASKPVCMDLVPARLYQHQFAPWPAVSQHETLVAPAATSATSEPGPGSPENALKLFDWLMQLNATPNTTGANANDFLSSPASLTEEAAYQCCEGLSTLESEADGSICASIQCGVHPDEEATYYSEGYVTVNDRDSEAELLLNGSMTDDEWA
jgi:hypothetical protein